jgi:hypothetical protein
MGQKNFLSPEDSIIESSEVTDNRQINRRNLVPSTFSKKPQKIQSQSRIRWLRLKSPLQKGATSRKCRSF